MTNWDLQSMKGAERPPLLPSRLWGLDTAPMRRPGQRSHTRRQKLLLNTRDVVAHVDVLWIVLILDGHVHSDVHEGLLSSFAVGHC